MRKKLSKSKLATLLDISSCKYCDSSMTTTGDFPSVTCSSFWEESGAEATGVGRGCCI